MKNSMIQSILSLMRKHKRRTVVQPAKLVVGDHNFDCTVYDISLGGVRLKVDLPLAHGTDVRLELKNRGQTAKVTWASSGFIGLSFSESSDKVKDHFGHLARGLT